MNRWSAFPFENSIHHLKKRIRSPNNILAQIHNRFEELAIHDFVDRHSAQMSITNKDPNNCILTEERKIVIVEETKADCFYGKEMILTGNLYNHPYASSVLNIGIYEKDHKLQIFKSSKVNKCVCFPLSNNQFMIFPLASQKSFYTQK